MKKLLSVICVILGIAIFAGCSGNNEPYNQKTYTPENEQIADICIDVRDRSVEVTPLPDDEIHIVYYDNSKDTYNISVSEDNILTMTPVSDKEWTEYIGVQASADERKILLQLPNALLDSLSISTTNEDIAVTSLMVNNSISLKANGGNISFKGLKAGNEIAINAKNGNINGDISGSYDDYAISCTIKKGETNLPANKEDGSKKLTVNANNGDAIINIG